MEKMKKFWNVKRNQIIFILTLIFIMMFILNTLTPLLADDYSYSFNLNHEKVSSLLDVFNYQVWHYFNWGGRIVAHSLAQIWLMLPKIVFNVLNTLVYVFVIYLIYLNVKGDNKEDKPIFLLIIHLLLWFLLPAYGQNILWLVGSCNYLWTLFFILLFLLLYRKNVTKTSMLKNIGLLLFGIIVGWTNENTAFGLITVLIGLMVIDKIYNKKKIPAYKMSGLIGTIIGFILLIIAPGNFVRSAKFVDTEPFLVKIVKRIIDYTINYIDYCLPLFIGIIVLISIYLYKKKKIDWNFIVFFIGSFFSVYSMIISPYFLLRSWIGVFIFLIMSLLVLLYNVIDCSKMYKFIFNDLVMVLVLIYVSSYLLAFNDINQLQNVWGNRIKYFEEQRENEIYDVKVYKYHSNNPHNPNYDGVDLYNNAENWPNNDIANYYGLKSVLIN